MSARLNLGCKKPLTSTLVVATLSDSIKRSSGVNVIKKADYLSETSEDCTV